jgi:hypothetical protein
MRRKKELGLLHLKITLFFFWLLSSKEFFFVFLFFLGYPSLKSKTYFLPAEHYAFFFSFLFFSLLPIFSFCSKSGDQPQENLAKIWLQDK